MHGFSKTGLMGGGVVLALLGLLGIAIPIFTTQQTHEVAKVGTLKLNATENKTYAVPPLLSGGALVLGIVLLGAGIVRRP